MKTLTENNKCDVCEKKANSVVYDREKGEVMIVCEDCRLKILEKGVPEYVVDCPNCGCEFGVN